MGSDSARRGPEALPSLIFARFLQEESCSCGVDGDYIAVDRGRQEEVSPPRTDSTIVRPKVKREDFR
jgi:hypothetical protein